MSIELKQAAQQAAEAIDWMLNVIRRDAPQISGKAMGNAEKCATDLRTAIQQAEAQQPATSEPVVSRNPFASRCYTMSESHLSGHRLIVGFEKLGDAQDAHEWVARQGRGDFTHPAPGVPDADFDLQELREIERAMDDFADCGETDVGDTLLMRAVRAGFLECTHFHVANRGALQDAIEAAMLAASPAQKGKP